MIEVIRGNYPRPVTSDDMEKTVNGLSPLPAAGGVSSYGIAGRSKVIILAQDQKLDPGRFLLSSFIISPTSFP